MCFTHLRIAELVHVHQPVILVVRNLSIPVHVSAIHDLANRLLVAYLAECRTELEKNANLSLNRIHEFETQVFANL